MTFYNKLNANERLVAIGAVIVIISWIVGAAGSFGISSGILSLLGAIAVLAIYYMKYSPTQTMTWPAPIQTIVLVISGIMALLAVIGLVGWLGVIGAFGIGSLYFLSVIGGAVGAVIMAWGAWQEYQAMPKTTPPSA